MSSASTSAPQREPLGADFHRLWFAQASSDAGAAIAMGALVLIAVRTLEASTLQVSLLTAVAGVVGGACALPLGPWVESHRKRPTMIAADLLRAVTVASVPVAAITGVLTYVHLLLVAAVVALGSALFSGASAANLKDLVPREQRTDALGKLESTFWFFNTVGPGVGGWIIQIAGSTATLGLQAVGLVLSAVGVSRIRRPETPPSAPERQHFLRKATAGFSVIATHSVLRPLCINSALFAGFIAWLSPLEMLLLLNDLRLPAWQYGLALALPSLGGIAGSWFAPHVSLRFGERRTLIWSASLRGVPMLALPFIPHGTWGMVAYVVLTTLLLTIAGIFRPAYTNLRMEVTDDAYMARVTTAFRLTSTGVAPLLALVGGAVATATNLRTAILVGVIGLVCSGFFLPRKRHLAGALA